MVFKMDTSIYKVELADYQSRRENVADYIWVAAKKGTCFVLIRHSKFANDFNVRNWSFSTRIRHWTFETRRIFSTSIFRKPSNLTISIFKIADTIEFTILTLQNPLNFSYQHWRKTSILRPLYPYMVFACERVITTIHGNMKKKKHKKIVIYIMFLLLFITFFYFFCQCMFKTVSLRFLLVDSHWVTAFVASLTAFVTYSWWGWALHEDIFFLKSRIIIECFGFWRRGPKTQNRVLYPVVSF